MIILSNTKYCKIALKFYMERSACHKMFFLKDKMAIFWTFSTCIGDGSEQFRWTLTYQKQFLDVIQSGFAVRNGTLLDVIWMKRSSSGVSSFLSARTRVFSSQLCLHKTIDYSVSNCFMNVKMTSNIINVETSFRYVNHSAAFVSSRLLRFLISKFHPLSVICWRLLPIDLVNTS